jgi:signal transduction histidine kinase
MWLIAVAVLFAAAAIVLALFQTGRISDQLIKAARPQADNVAEEARRRFDRETDLALQSLLAQLREKPDWRNWSPPTTWPPWLTSVNVWNGSTLGTLWEAEPTEDSLKQVLASRLATGEILESGESLSSRYRMISDTAGPRNFVSVYARGALKRGQPITVAVVVDEGIVKSRILDRLVRPDDVLALVPASEARGTWWVRLPPPFRSWSIEPTQAFVESQLNTIRAETSAYVALSVLSLAILLVNMFLAMRVAKRATVLAKLKSDFVARVSHELKTPLALIRMFGETLEAGRVNSDEKRREYYGVISRESARLTNMIDNILDFARIDAGKQAYELSRTDIAEVVGETYEAYRLQLDSKGFTHKLKIGDDLPTILADRDAIAQALINLMGNAIKYSQEEKHLAIELSADTRRDRKGVLISVSDRGIGISAEDRRHLFEGFYRADDQRVRAATGTGLGLSVVKHIIDAHHGTLDVESRLVKGTIFRIFLPGSPPANNGQVDKESPDEAT